MTPAGEIDRSSGRTGSSASIKTASARGGPAWLPRASAALQRSDHDSGHADGGLHGEGVGGMSCAIWEPIVTMRIGAASVFRRTAMKLLILCTAILVIAFAPAAEAKGCIKGAIVGGIAGHIAGHGKVGAVAGCIIGHHEANKRDAQKADQKAPPADSRDNRI